MTTARKYQLTAKRKVLCSALGKIILPTGTGKSYIQGMVIEQVISNFNPAIAVILTPRIMLTNQLAKDVGRQLAAKGIDVQFLVMHSGEREDFLFEGERDDLDNMPEFFKQQLACLGGDVVTNSNDLAIKMQMAKFEKKSLVICCTYHSCNKLTLAFEQANLVADQVLCDEAHYVIEPKFNEQVAALKNYANSMHFFTATEKVSSGSTVDSGLGMQNEEFYGPTLYTSTPRQMIQEGWIVGPRMHIEYSPADKTEGALVASAYDEHSKHVPYDAKLLVCCAGYKYIKKVITDAAFNAYVTANNVKVFHISSAGGAWIDGVDYTRDRNTFLSQLRAWPGKAIVLHINILTEGIDVPDFSGVMFMRNMELARFMQSIGRAMRRHAADKAKTIEQFDQWVKKYAWAIFVEREGVAEDEETSSNLKSCIQRMRDAGFLEGVDLRTEVVLSHDEGKSEVEIERTNEEDDAAIRSKFSDFFDIVHMLEREEKARVITETAEKLVKDFVDSMGW